MQSDKMKIGIIEVCSKNHICMIENWIQIAQINDWEITVFTIPEFKDQLDNEILKYKKLTMILNSNKKMSQFFQNIEILSIDFDYIIITSLQAHFLEFLFFKPKCKIHLTIHNANTWFVKSRIYSIKTLLKKIIRTIYLKKVDAFIVNSINMLNYIENRVSLKKPIYVVPFSMKQRDKIKKEKNSRISIVYPGMVSKIRKNYDFFLKLANDYTECDFILLGKINYDEGGEDILNKISSMKLKNVYYFDFYIDQKIYNSYMEQADILFSYINIDYNNAGYSEIYGQSKDSGVSYLMLEYCLPLLVNRGFNNFTELEDFTYLYDDYISLKNQLEKLLNNNTNNHTNKKFSKARQEFSIDFNAAKINNILTKD